MKLTQPGAPLTLREIEAFESEIGGRLPDDYKRFLLESNGGFPESPIGFRWNGEINSILFFEMLTPEEEEIGLGPGLSHLRELKINGFLPVASVDINGRDVCLSFLGDVGQVSLAVYEFDDQEPVNANMVCLTHSFTEFLGNLFEIPSVYCPIEDLGKHGAPPDLAGYLSKGNSVDELSKNNLTIICEAIRFQNVPMIKACIDQGATLSKTLHQSVTLGHPEILTLLLDAGADVNEQDESGHRPLYYVGGTALGGEDGAMNRKVQELLIQSGAVK